MAPHLIGLAMPLAPSCGHFTCLLPWLPFCRMSSQTAKASWTSSLAALQSKRALARTWRMIVQVLDGDFTLARGMVTWMPAHGSVASIGCAKDSRSRPVDATMWRANRLVDLLAKAAAAPHRLPESARVRLQSARSLYLHHTARLGMATYAANNYHTTVSDDAGVAVHRVLRDSTAARPWASRQRRRSQAPTPPAQPVATPGSRAHSTPGRRRPAPGTAAQLWADVEAEVSLARWIANLVLRPGCGPTAAERLAAVRERVAARQRLGVQSQPT